MIHIPPGIYMRNALVQGSVLNFSHQEGVKNHFYVLLNKEPKTSAELFFVYFTSQIESVRRRFKVYGRSMDTFFDLPSDSAYSFLPRPQDACIDCNVVVTIPNVEDLICRVGADGDYTYPAVVPSDLENILTAVRLSDEVSDLIKEAL